LGLIRLAAATNVEIGVHAEHSVVVPERKLELLPDVGLFLRLPPGAVLVLELKAKGKQLLPPPSGATRLAERPLDPGCAAIVLEIEVRPPSQAAGNPRQRCRLVDWLGCRPRS